MTATESCSLVAGISENRMKHHDRGDVASSPTSVVAAQMLQEDAVIEPIVLNDWEADDSSGGDVEGWICPASKKSMRTINPIRAIVDPIAKNIQTGEQRGDGKDLISLAVSNKQQDFCLESLCFYLSIKSLMKNWIVW